MLSLVPLDCLFALLRELLEIWGQYGTLLRSVSIAAGFIIRLSVRIIWLAVLVAFNVTMWIKDTEKYDFSLLDMFVFLIKKINTILSIRKKEKVFIFLLIMLKYDLDYLYIFWGGGNPLISPYNSFPFLSFFFFWTSLFIIFPPKKNNI